VRRRSVGDRRPQEEERSANSSARARFSRRDLPEVPTGWTSADSSRTPPPPRSVVSRCVIEAVTPQVDGGRFPVKAIVGDTVKVEADIFMDGHAVVACDLWFRQSMRGPRNAPVPRTPLDRPEHWSAIAMRPLGNDRWEGHFVVTNLGEYRFVITATEDRFATWRRDVMLRIEACQQLDADLAEGLVLLENLASRAEGADSQMLVSAARALASISSADQGELSRRVVEILTENLNTCARRYVYDGDATCTPEFPVVVDPAYAQFSSWYELFPRSTSPDPRRPGTFRDVIDWLPYIAGMGFDVLYLPPIHPIGLTNRKGRDGVTTAGSKDPGSPWAIGSAAGGHTAVHPELGTIEDFDRLVTEAQHHGIAVALDMAWQASPDHPWVREHPDWFQRRPDGTIRHAENPPKHYEDIYPIDFATSSWRELWIALLMVTEYWIDHGVSIFRVDNPHTKPFRFWEWLIGAVKETHPEVIFLSEAFTRPKVMKYLAKLGFSQSYTYFTWRTTKWELESYLTELTQPDVIDYFRPNFWPNTPDILPEHLQIGGRPTFMARLVLAATLSSNYGIYGPAFELGECLPRSAGSEEYLGSEKYIVRTWNLHDPRSLAPFIGQVNRIRRENPALAQMRTLRLHKVDNEQLIVYSKTAGSNVIVVVVNLDFRYRQSGWVDLDIAALGLAPDARYTMHDLLTGTKYPWQGQRNFVMLDPELPAHIFRLERDPRDA